MKTICIFGDSIGQGVIFNEERYRICTDHWAALLKTKGYDVRNFSSLGYTVENGLNKLSRVSLDPGSICLIAFGGNDCDLDWKAVAEHPEIHHDEKVEPERFLRLLHQMIGNIREMSLIPVLLTPPPVLAAAYFNRVSANLDGAAILKYLVDVEHICRQQESYANSIRYVAQNTGSRLIDVRQTFLRQPDLPSLMCSDGIHLNENGHRIYAEAVDLGLQGIE